jgi:hypothetical protein
MVSPVPVFSQAEQVHAKLLQARAASEQPEPCDWPEDEVHGQKLDMPILGDGHTTINR